MPLVRETLTWATDEAAVKAYLEITAPTWEVQLELWYTQAAQEADVYFEYRDWDDDPTNPILDHVGIRVGCYDWVRACFEGYKNKAAAGGVTSIKTAQLARGFAAPQGGGGLNLVELGRRAASPSWRPYKADVLIGGLL
jgi:hypothetical protein